MNTWTAEHRNDHQPFGRGLREGAAVELPRGLRINCISPTVLAESVAYHAYFAGFIPVPAWEVGLSARDFNADHRAHPQAAQDQLLTRRPRLVHRLNEESAHFEFRPSMNEIKKGSE